MPNQFLNRPKKQPSGEQDSEARFAAAESAMAQGGYANKTARPSDRASTRSPTSFSLTAADRARLMQLQGELMTTGRSASKTDVIRLGLAALEALPAETRARLFDGLA